MWAFYCVRPSPFLPPLLQLCKALFKQTLTYRSSNLQEKSPLSGLTRPNREIERHIQAKYLPAASLYRSSCRAEKRGVRRAWDAFHPKLPHQQGHRKAEVLLRKSLFLLGVMMPDFWKNPTALHTCVYVNGDEPAGSIPWLRCG